MRSFPRPHGADQKNQASLLLGGTSRAIAAWVRPLGSPSSNNQQGASLDARNIGHVAAEFKCKSFRVVNSLTPAMIA